MEKTGPSSIFPQSWNVHPLRPKMYSLPAIFKASHLQLVLESSDKPPIPSSSRLVKFTHHLFPPIKPHLKSKEGRLVPSSPPIFPPFLFPPGPVPPHGHGNCRPQPDREQGNYTPLS